MTSRRRRTIRLSALAAVLVLTVLGYTLSHDPYPCRHTFDQVREGMTYGEVVATVGARPGNYLSPGHLVILPHAALDRETESWCCDDGEFLVRFVDGQVAEVSTGGAVIDLSPSYWKRLRARLGL